MCKVQAYFSILLVGSPLPVFLPPPAARFFALYLSLSLWSPLVMFILILINT